MWRGEQARENEGVERTCIGKKEAERNVESKGVHPAEHIASWRNGPSGLHRANQLGAGGLRGSEEVVQGQNGWSSETSTVWCDSDTSEKGWWGACRQG
jgi:hypothetical protein